MNSLLLIYILISIGTFLGGMSEGPEYPFFVRLLGSIVIGLISPIFLSYKLARLKY